jgi:hypothetical protein
VKQPVLPCGLTKDMRVTIEQRSLVPRLDEGEWEQIFGLTGQSDLNLVPIPDIADLWVIRRRLPSPGD